MKKIGEEVRLMRTGVLLTAVVLCILWSLSGHAQDANLPFNFHIGGGFGVPVGASGRFAGLSGSFQVGAGPNLSKHGSVMGEFFW